MATIAVLKASMLKPSLCRFAGTVNSALFQKYGTPSSVVKVQKTPLKDVSAHEVQIKMVSAPVTSYDLDTVMGKAPAGFTFPAIAGNEGVGIVEKVGSAVTYFKENDTVMLIKPFQGTWTEKMVVSDEKVLPVPKGVTPESACAMLSSAGIAYRLLHDFVSLSAGDVVIQNDSCSPVGRALIQLCKARGIKTVNIIKECKKNCKCTEKLQGLGADVIIKESQMNGTDFIKMVKNLPPVKLVLNGRGGNVMSEVCKYVKNADVVTYNQTSNEGFTMCANTLMNNNITLKGFNMNCWLNSASMAEVKAMVDDLAKNIRNNELTITPKVLYTQDKVMTFDN